MLSRASWDEDAVAGDVRDYVTTAFADPDAVLVLDETGDVKKGVATVGVQRQCFGTAGRNILRAPDTFNLNASVFRTFPITERFHLQFRAESYNLSNTAHFAAPASNVSSGNFLVITSAAQDQRQFRLALKMTF